jgi:hypothetical protein
MDEIEEIILRLKIIQLQAQAALCEMERITWNAKIDDRNTDEDERYIASIRRDRSIVEWGEIMTELQESRDRQARELDLKPRAELN